MNIDEDVHWGVPINADLVPKVGVVQEVPKPPRAKWFFCPKTP